MAARLPTLSTQKRVEKSALAVLTVGDARENAADAAAGVNPKLRTKNKLRGYCSCDSPLL